jgi:predicted molibdopterin-dependent oxidoreductase YjgC
VGCTMNVNTRHDRIVNVGPAPGKRTAPHQLCVRGKFVPPDLVHHPMRITSPLIRKEGHWVEVSWEEALQHTAERLQHIGGNHFGIIGQAQDTLENNYILQKFTRTVMQSNHVDLFGSYPDNDLISNIHRYHGQEAPVKIDDITSADTLLVMGSHAFLSHPLVENRIRKAYKKGVTVIDVHSHRSRTTTFSSLHLTYDPGGEYRFLITLLAGLSADIKGTSSREVIKQLKQSKLNKISGGGGLSRQEYRSLQDILLNARDLIIVAGDGIFRSSDGARIFNALMFIRRLLRGHCRILFLLDEGNRYGGTLAGMHPGYLGGFDKVNDIAAVTKWEQQWNATLNRHPGFSSDEMIKNINKDGLTSLFVIGDIPAHSNLAGLQFFVQHNMFLTKTSDYAHVFLPLASLSEDAGHVVNFEGKLKMMPRVLPPSEGARPSWQTVAGIAGKMGIPEFEMSGPGEIMMEIESTIGLTFNHGGKNMKRLTLEPVIAGQSDDGFSLLVEPNAFHYLGNSLTALMPDMKAIRDEGVLLVSPSLSGELGLQDNEQVLVETSYGNLIAEVRTDHEMENRTAGFYPGLEQYRMFTDGLNMNRNHLTVKIKPLQNG